MRNSALCLAAALLSVSAASPAPWTTTAPGEIFRRLGLTDQQRAVIEGGRPVAKVLSWGAPSEVYVFGAVHVDGVPATYLSLARRVAALGGTPGYLAVSELPQTPTVADLSGLMLDADDIKALKSCREGTCDVQLPTASMQAFHDTVNWSEADTASQVNALARRMMLDLLADYRRGGNAALGVYRDKQNPARVAEQFETMAGRSAAALPDLLPELRSYLLNFPGVDLPGADSFFYWENVSFGLKPTIRLNHGVVYHGAGGEPGVSVVAIKQLYASHYFHTALDVTICVADAAHRPPGFYLMTLKSSEQDGLTGPKGAILRKIVVSKTRSSLETALGSIKDAVEHSPSTQ